MEEQRRNGSRRENGELVGYDLDGVYYPLAPLTPEDIRECERELSRQRSSAAAALKEAMKELADSPAALALMADRAFEKARLNAGADGVTSRQVFEWLDTQDGTEFSVWLMLRKGTPGLTREQVHKVIDGVSLADMQSARDEANARNIQKGTFA